jgi:hypothetical protein
MKGQFLYWMAVLVAWAGAAETVTKYSAQFTFPTTVGVIRECVFQDREVSFVCTPHLLGSDKIEVSWAIPSRVTKGSVSFFTLSGSLVKSFPISSSIGRLEWNIGADKKIGGNIYLVTLSTGTYKKNIKLVIYR